MKEIFKITLLNIILIVFILACSTQGKDTVNTASINLSEQNQDLSDHKQNSNEPISHIKPINIELKPSEFVKWIKNENNGLVRQKQLGEINYQLNYLPQEYMVCNELKSNTISKVEFEETKQQFNDLIYFILTIKVPGAQEPAKFKLAQEETYENRIKYLSFDMQNDIKIHQNDEIIPCAMYSFERMYNSVPYSNFLIAFSDKDINPEEKITVVFEDRIFNNGTVKFSWTNNELNHIPKVKLL